MYCINCGKELREGAKFCSNCGTPVANAPNAQNEQKAEAPQQAYVQQPAAAPVKKSGKGKIGLIIGIAVAMVAIAVAVAIIAIGGNGGNGKVSKLNGTYEDKNWGVVIQFKKDGSYIFESDSILFFEGKGDQGTYTIGDGNRIYFSDKASVWEFTYDEKADLINWEDSTGIFYRVDDKKLGKDKDSNGDSVQGDDEEIRNTSADEETYRNAADEFLSHMIGGNPIEMGWATDSSYLQKMAESNSHYYWYWSAGGGYGVISQSKENPNDMVTPADGEEIISAIWENEGYQGSNTPYIFDEIMHIADNVAISGSDFGNVTAQEWAITKDGKTKNYLWANSNDFPGYTVFVREGNSVSKYCDRITM